MSSSYPPSSPGVGNGGEGASASSASSSSGERSFDRAVHATHEAVDRAAKSLDEAADRVRQGVDRMRGTEEEWAEACRAQVRAHPLSILLAAVGVGVLLGCLASRSHH